MVTIEEWLNPTRAVGLLAYGTAVTCCGIAWVRDKNQRQDGRLAGLLTLIEVTLLLDIAFNWRWTLHQLLMDSAQRANEYQIRRIPQLIVLLILLGILSLGLFRVRRFFRGSGGSSLAVSGVLLSVVLWCAEVISLHQVDHVLYHRLGNMMAVSLLWILACLMTSIGILMVSPEWKRGVQPDLH
jgi:hypothetical protein